MNYDNDRSQSRYWALKVADLKRMLTDAQRNLDQAVAKEDSHVYRENKKVAPSVGHRD